MKPRFSVPSEVSSLLEQFRNRISNLIPDPAVRAHGLLAALDACVSGSGCR
jgi:hypothetical protein